MRWQALAVEATTLIACCLFAPSALAQSQVVEAAEQPPASSQADAIIKSLPVKCQDKYKSQPDLGIACWYPWTRPVSIGAGIPAVSFRFDGKIGLLNQVAPLEISLNFLQRRDYSPATISKTDYVFWRAAIGFSIAKNPDIAGVTFGAYVSPWGIRIDNFQAGIGIGYQAADEVEFGTKNFSIVLPLTYSIAL